MESSERRDNIPSAFKLIFSTFKESKEPIPSSSPEYEMLLAPDKSIEFAEIRIRLASASGELKTTLPT